MIGYGLSGITHDFFCFDSSGQVWNGSAFVSWVDGDYASYRVTATEVGTTGRFTGTAPSGTETYELRERGVSVALSYAVWADDSAKITAKTDLIGTGSATITSPVADAGTIEKIVRGADYKTTNSRAFIWTISDPGNIATPGSAVCTFAGRKHGEESTSTNVWSVTGTASDVGGGNYTLTFELSDTDTSSLDLGDYEWSVEVIDDSGNKIVPVLTDRQRLTRLVEKFS